LTVSILMSSLSSTRKKRKPAAGYAKAADVKTYQQTSHVPSLHQTKLAGISALDLASDGKTILTGGPDKTVQVFDLENSKVVATLKGHTKTVNHVAFRESTEGTLAISGGDKTVRVWGEDDGKWGAKTSFSHKKGEIAGFAVHPSGNFVSAASTDSTWSMYDLSEGKEVATYSAVAGVEGGFSYTSFAVHPDGVLHGCGTKDGLVRVWDARQATSLAGSIESHSKAVSTLSFSENGYYLATGSSADPTVNIIDLRKLSILSSWTLPTENTVSEVRFDASAQFLTVSGTDLRVYANKTWDELLKFEENAGVLSGARFGPLGQQIVVAGMDRALRVLGVKSE
jgi:pre-mRNA-processing factor 19